jgi:hypothetical protein
LPFAIAAQSARLPDVSPDEKLELLRRFAPTLHFDALERWRPTLVDDYLRESTVRDGRGKARPGTPPAEPTMREHTSSRKARLNPLHNDSDLDTRRRSREMLSTYARDEDLTGAGVAYGRVVPASRGRIFLQYWFFYPDNPCVLSSGRHDGDWELAQLKLKRKGDRLRLTRATLAEHGKPVTHRVPAAKGDKGPDVFVAVDSHASYAREGAQPALPLSDVCQPTAPGGQPRVELLPIAEDKRDWVHWPGRWGLDRGGGTRFADRFHLPWVIWPLTRLNKSGDSPPGPAHQGTSWRFPKLFASTGAARKSISSLQQLAHLIGNLTWPESDPEVSVAAGAVGDGGAPTYAIEVGTAGHFLRRVSFVSVAFWEERADGSRRALAMYSVDAGATTTVEVPHEGRLAWRAAGYNLLRQRGEPILPKPH